MKKSVRSWVWFVMRFDSVVCKWQASGLKVMNQNGNLNIYTAELPHVVHVWLKITKACFYT